MVIIIGGKTTIVSRKENKEPKEQRTRQIIHIFAVPVAPQWPLREKRTRLVSRKEAEQQRTRQVMHISLCPLPRRARCVKKDSGKTVDTGHF